MNFIKTNNLIETLAERTANLLELTELIQDTDENSYMIVAKVKDKIGKPDLISAGQDPDLNYLVLRNNVVNWYTDKDHYNSVGMLSYDFAMKRDYTKRALGLLRDDYLENMVD